MASHSPIELTIGSAGVTLRRKGSSSAVVAGVIRRCVEEGEDRIYLDRRVHDVGDAFTGDWRASGAVTTVLARAA